MDREIVDLTVLGMEHLRKVQVKGRHHEFMIYELLGIRGSNDPELAIREEDALLSEMTWHASKSFEEGDFSESARRYRAVLNMFATDPVARSLISAIAIAQLRAQ